MRILWVSMAMALACAGCKKSDTAAKAGAGGSDQESANADEGAAVTLQVKWPVGHRYTERLEVDSDTKTLMAKPVQQKVQLNQEYSITVLTERPKGGKELEMEFDSTEMEVTVNGKSVLNLDTKAEAGTTETANPVASSFRQVVGTKIKYFLDASNNVEKIEGLKDFVQKASAGSNPQARQMIQGMFDDERFKHLVEFNRALPPKPVKAGDTWPVKTDITVPMLGKLTLDLNYTFTGWQPREKRRCAAIDFQGTMSSATTTNPPAAGMTIKIESGKLSGKTWFDPELGNPVETEIHEDLVMHMAVPRPRSSRTNAAAQPPSSQNITNHTKQKTVIKLLEVVSAGK